MSEVQPLYEIRVKGHLSPRRLCCFEGFAVTELPHGETALVGPIRDQSALFGLLSWLQDLGLTLLLVKRVGKDQSTLNNRLFT